MEAVEVLEWEAAPQAEVKELEGVGMEALKLLKDSSRMVYIDLIWEVKPKMVRVI